MINVELLSEDWTYRETFPKGHVIIVDGEAPDGKMHIIEKGSVGIYKNYQSKGEIRITELSEGDFFGEMNLFLQKRRTATVVAKTDVTTIAIERVDALKFLETQPEATFSLIQTLCKRLENTTLNSADNSARYEEDLLILNDEKMLLEKSANTDALTGAYNRRFFMDSIPFMIPNALREEKLPFLVLFDLDHFKKVNDTYGHQAGDFVLQCFAEMVNYTVRASDIFARYGGEEFIMLISCGTQADARTLIERIRLRIMDSIVEYEDKVIPITASIGVASVKTGSNEDIEDAIAQADQALYKAKSDGRNRVVFYNEKPLKS